MSARVPIERSDLREGDTVRFEPANHIPSMLAIEFVHQGEPLYIAHEGEFFLLERPEPPRVEPLREPTLGRLTWWEGVDPGAPEARHSQIGIFAPGPDGTFVDVVTRDTSGSAIVTAFEPMAFVPAAALGDLCLAYAHGVNGSVAPIRRFLDALRDDR